MRKIACSVLFLAASIVGYATEADRPSAPTYWDLTTSYQIPKTEADRKRECTRIRREMARLETFAQAENVTLPPMDSINELVRARENMARLDSRAAEVSCLAAFSSSTASKKMSYDECF
jgi:hypothetical protein